MTDMKHNLIRLNELRGRQEFGITAFTQKKMEFEKENLELMNLMASIASDIIGVELQIKESALIKYEENGEKKLMGGVGIRIMKRLEYEESKALSWAKDHNLALTLNKQVFDKIAKVDYIDFVKVSEVVTATIPKEINLEAEK